MTYICLRQNLKKFLGVVIFSCVFFCNSFSLAASLPKSSVNIIVLIDASHSMNEFDPGGVAMEVAKMFVDISYKDNINVGYILYNDTILKSAMITPNDLNAIKNAKNDIDTTKCFSYTDMSLGLKTACQLVNNLPDPANTIMFILSDGDAHYEHSSLGRTSAQMQQDFDSAIEHARKYKYPIYPMVINNREFVDQALLEKIATQTNGKLVVVNNPKQMLELCIDIFAKFAERSFSSIAVVSSNGSPQDVKLNISDATKADVIFSTNNQLSWCSYEQENNVDIIPSRYYTLVKGLQPNKGGNLIKYQSPLGEVITVYALKSYDAEILLSKPDEPVYQDKNTIFTVSLMNSGRNISADNKEISSRLIIKNIDDNTEQQIEMQKKNNGFETSYTFPKGGNYQANAAVSISNIISESAKLDIVVQRSFWPHIFLTVAAVIVGLFILLNRTNKTKPIFSAPKPIFRGKLEGYFLDTASGEDIPVLSWLPVIFKGKSELTLSQMFEALNVREVLPESNRILFKVGENETLIFKHNTNCDITNNGVTAIERNKAVVLHYNERIYITFEDGLTEIEIRYKKMKNK